MFALIIFVSKTSNTINRIKYSPEYITPFLCLNPMYSHATTEFPCEVVLDSGAYQNENRRVTFDEALIRQQRYEKKLGYPAKYIVAYDKIGDPEITMDANKFLLHQPLPENQQKIVVVQGTTDDEYSKCLKQILDLSNHHEFVLGFGGIAKAGVNSNIENKLYCAVSDNYSKFSNIKHIHLFGVLNKRITRFFEYAFPDKILSVDTAGIEIRSVMGNVFQDGRYHKVFSKEQKFIDYHPNDLAHDNIRRVLDYYDVPRVYMYSNLCEAT